MTSSTSCARSCSLAAKPIWEDIPPAWQPHWRTPALQAHWQKLNGFLQHEWQHETVYPPRAEIFAALALTPPEAVKVLILGQDPYHNPGQAHGFSFSVPAGVPLPPSLKHIYAELQSDLGLSPPAQGSLIPWAQQGVLLLNTVLTVRAHQPASHQKQGWETLTDALIASLSAQQPHMVFVLWGRFAQHKSRWIDSRHSLIQSAHPSPLSAYRGFFGSRPFSAVNQALQAHGQSPIDWQLQS